MFRHGSASKGDKGKQPTKVSGSSRRAKTAENPSMKQSQKRSAEARADKTTHPEPATSETTRPKPEVASDGEPTQVNREPDVMDEGGSGVDIVYEKKAKEEQREVDVVAHGHVPKK
ncbi:hypothetical protein QL285_037920 [Trifolium repens]|nr:hypothetical protein QL285_037920 [Trifolium repens]